VDTFKAEETTTGELNQPIWAVVSSDRSEATGLTYAEAVVKMSELKALRSHGLTIVTAEAASRITEVVR
jgi:hypothetical protein